MNTITEDERYRVSTQYRLWSFTPASLHILRTTTNQNAADRVREAVRRALEAQALSSAEASDADLESGSRGTSTLPEGDVDCLTVEEELKLITFYCRQTLQLGDHLKLPTDVKATAVQYIKRFYTTNSLMTYDPATILRTALFFATKTENHYYRLTKFANAIEKTKPEDVLASEFLLTQGLRFTFDVRHPFRALEGAVMEMGAMTSGDIAYDRSSTGPPPENSGRRVQEAHGKAREYLKTSALLSDVYFHFTPSQIMMSSLLIADAEVVFWYLSSKFGTDPQLGEKVFATLSECVNMLKTVEPVVSSSAIERKDVKELSKKLKKCRNPEKIDLVALQKVKREGEDGTDEKVLKKRKMEREASAKEGERLFGPNINK